LDEDGILFRIASSFAAVRSAAADADPETDGAMVRSGSGFGALALAGGRRPCRGQRERAERAGQDSGSRV
jgi:hypothetical protein